MHFHETKGGFELMGLAKTALLKYLKTKSTAVTVNVNAIEETVNKHGGELTHAIKLDDDWYCLVFKGGDR